MIVVEPGRPGWALVTFRHRASGHAVAVAGDFNQWRPMVPPGTIAGDEWTATLEIPTGARYRFHYVLDGEHWEPDDAADGAVPNERHGEDSLLDLRHDGPHADRLGLADSRAVDAQRGDGAPPLDTSI